MNTVLIFFTAAVVAIVNCADESKDAALLSTGSNEFTAKMFSEVAKENPNKSFVLSAFSVLTPLAQLALASQGKSHNELLTAIGLPDDQSIKSVFSYVNSKFRSIKGVDLKMASKIYVANGYALNDEFAAVSRNTFQSEVKNVDFERNKETATEINTWVEDQTNHRIKDLVDPKSLSGDTRLVLVNAIYFKGTWKYPFQESFTRPRDFHVSRDKKIQVPTMYQKETYNYGESETLDAKILELPYVGDEAAFYFILPNEIDGINALESKLKNSLVLENAIQNLYEIEVEAHIPKFKIETTTNLKEILPKVGVQEIFGGGANLSKLVKNLDNLYVSEAIQKAFIEINEEGAEAAAANAFIITESMLVGPNIVFVADRPFVYQIRVNNIPVFSGIYNGL